MQSFVKRSESPASEKRFGEVSDSRPEYLRDGRACAAGLRLRHGLRRRPAALVSQFGLSNADAINVARWKSGRTGESNVERVNICAFAAQIFGLQHEANVASAAAVRLRIPKGVVNDPFVDHPRLLDIRLRALRDFGGCRLHDTVGRQELGRPQEMLQFLAALLWRCAPCGEVDRAILRGDLVRHREDRFYSRRKFRGDDSERIGLALDQLCGTAIAVEGIRECFLEGRFTNERRRHPNARRPRRFQNLDAGRYLKCAPTVGRGDLRKQTPSPRKREAYGHNAP